MRVVGRNRLRLAVVAEQTLDLVFEEFVDILIVYSSDYCMEL